MWKTPFKTPSTHISMESPFNSITSQSEHEEDPFTIPEMISLNPEYEKIFDKIHITQRKAYHSVSQEEKKKQVNHIKDIISIKIDHDEKKKTFDKKFGTTMIIKSARMKTARHFGTFIGETTEQENNEKLNIFLIDHKNAVELEEQARLTEYHLKDQEKEKSKTDYLTMIDLTDKHRRTTPNYKDRSSRLFQPDSEPKYHLLRKIAYIGTDKPINMAIKNAKNNPTFQRKKNFTEIQYILNQDSQNLMMTKEIKKDINKEKIYSLTRRIFLSLATVSDSLRSYYQYIKETDLNKIVDLFHPLLGASTPQEYLPQTIEKIIKYKQNKVIHFEDFNELISTIYEEKKINVLEKFISSANSKNQTNDNELLRLVRSHIDEFILENKQKINDVIKIMKFEVIIRKIYELNNNKIIGKEYLSIRDLTEIMKNLGIVPHEIGMAKFIHTCFWHEIRREGFSMKEFIAVQVYLGLELKFNLQGLEEYFKLFNISQIQATS